MPYAARSDERAAFRLLLLLERGSAHSGGSGLPCRACDVDSEVLSLRPPQLTEWRDDLRFC